MRDLAKYAIVAIPVVYLLTRKRESVKPPEKKTGIELIRGVHLTKLCYRTVPHAGIYFSASIRNNSGRDVTLHRIWFEGMSYRGNVCLGEVECVAYLNRVINTGQEIDVNISDNYPQSRFENGAVIKNVRIGFEFFTPKLGIKVLRINRIDIPSEHCIL